jgi:ribulose-phosphate 3-epimerase
MAIIVPTITAENPHTYREQIERVQGFAERLHIDLMDGEFTPNKSVSLDQVWWPENTVADIHLMFENPEAELSRLIALKPNLVVIHAQTNCDIADFARKLNHVGISCGVALFPETDVSVISTYHSEIQQILIFSGNLGHQGGSVANLTLLDKVAQIKAINSKLEVAWDGGVNDSNVTSLAQKGVEVINVGGYIHTAYDASKAYYSLTKQL